MSDIKSTYERATELKCGKYTFDEIYDSDMQWVKFQNNKIVQREILNYILKDTPNAVFVGGFIFADPDGKIKSLVDVETNDIISPLLKRKTGKNGRQSIYNTLEEYMTANPSIPDKVNYYLVGDGHGSGNNIAIHWNCFVVDRIAKEFDWYDPAFDEMSVRDSAYNFNLGKLGAIIEYWDKILPKDYIFPFDKERVFYPTHGQHRAQQVCSSDEAGADVFCQSWVLAFIAADSHKLLDRFINLHFEVYQNLILKSWLVCVLTQMQDYKTDLDKYFGLNYCRLSYTIEHIELKKIPRIPKAASCIEAVIQYFEADYEKISAIQD